MFIIYNNTNLIWEKQFILQDLLPKYDLIITDPLKLCDINYFKSMHDINDIIGENIFIFSSNIHTYDEVKNIVILLKPIIIFHLSDDGNARRPEYQELSFYTKLLVRQYYQKSYKHYDNIIYMPAGYNNMMEYNYLDLKLKRPDERAYKWSFIGNIKHDRQHMINLMTDIKPYFFGNESTQTTREIYRNSIFVPNGRGNALLDCLRLYEASSCGAIPIVVGNKHEIEITFSKEEDPPWIFCDSWEKAFDKCNNLLSDKKLLNEMSNNCLSWWKKRINNLKYKINNVLKIT